MSCLLLPPQSAIKSCPLVSVILSADHMGPPCHGGRVAVGLSVRDRLCSGRAGGVGMTCLNG